MTALDLLVPFSTLATAFALVPAGAHALELANKMQMSREEYFTVQRIYRGWNRAGIFEGLALISAIVVLILLRDNAIIRLLSLLSVISLLGMAIAFWFFTLPANKHTDNWTTVPAEWEKLRHKWEYSHAARAVCAAAALVALVIIGVSL